MLSSFCSSSTFLSKCFLCFSPCCFVCLSIILLPMWSLEPSIFVWRYSALLICLMLTFPLFPLWSLQHLFHWSLALAHLWNLLFVLLFPLKCLARSSPSLLWIMTQQSSELLLSYLCAPQNRPAPKLAWGIQLRTLSFIRLSGFRNKSNSCCPAVSGIHLTSVALWNCVLVLSFIQSPFKTHLGRVMNKGRHMYMKS